MDAHWYHLYQFKRLLPFKSLTDEKGCSGGVTCSPPKPQTLTQIITNMQTKHRLSRIYKISAYPMFNKSQAVVPFSWDAMMSNWLLWAHIKKTLSGLLDTVGEAAW